jgi:hypothetical protein
LEKEIRDAGFLSLNALRIIHESRCKKKLVFLFEIEKRENQNGDGFLSASDSKENSDST